MLIMNFMTTYYNRVRENGQENGRTFFSIRIFFKLLIIPAVAIAMLTACEEEPSVIGGGILPGSDFNSLISIDTFSIKSYTGYLDSLRSSQPSYSYLGSYYSPYFGLTKAGFATQMWLYGAWPGASVSWDSLIFSIRISGVIGATPDYQTVNIWEVDEYMHQDSTYYTTRDVPLKQLLGTFTLDGISDMDTVLSFHMPRLFIDELMRDTTMIYLKEDTVDFRDYFNGLYFEFPQAQNYHMAQVNLTGGGTGLTLYYTDTASIKRSFIFLFNTKAAYYNTFRHDFDAADPEKKIKYINQEIEDTVSYVQGFNGVYTTIRIPGLEELKASMPMGINKARLYLPAFTDETDFPKDKLPDRVIARYVNSEGDRMLLTDYQLSSDFMDGQFYSLDEQYILNITNFVQEYLEGDIPEPEIEIVLSSFARENAIFYGNNGARKPKLEIVYTSF